jgi:hypothetical protein
MNKKLQGEQRVQPNKGEWKRNKESQQIAEKAAGARVVEGQVQQTEI